MRVSDIWCETKWELDQVLIDQMAVNPCQTVMSVLLYTCTLQNLFILCPACWLDSPFTISLNVGLKLCACHNPPLPYKHLKLDHISNNLTVTIIELHSHHDSMYTAAWNDESTGHREYPILTTFIFLLSLLLFMSFKALNGTKMSQNENFKGDERFAL